MITIKNAKTLEGSVQDLCLKSSKDYTIDAKGSLLLLPAIIDTHAQLAIPNTESHEDWKVTANAAIAGGIATIFDIVNTTERGVGKSQIVQKIDAIHQELVNAQIPLNYQLYLDTDQNHFEEIGNLKKLVSGIKIAIDCTASEFKQSTPFFEKIFQIAALNDIMVIVDSEDERILQKLRLTYGDNRATYSIIRDRKAAISTTKCAIDFAEKYNTQVYILNISTKEEIDLISQAKKNSILAFAETSPLYLFLTESDLEKSKSLQMPFILNNPEDQEALWEAIRAGTIDALGSGHTQEFPQFETFLPLLLNAYHENKISLEKIVELTNLNVSGFFNMDRFEAFVLVDLEKKQMVQKEKLKLQYSPFIGRTLQGWPVYTIIKDRVFKTC